MIYIVEDDATIRELLVYTLNGQGFEAEGFENPADFWAAMDRENPPRLVILDIMLPGEDGLHILGRLRKAPETRRLPVIMLTAKGSEYDKVVGLDAGADDYIPKPFGIMELLARIKALLRRTDEAPAAKGYTVGELSVIPEKHRVLVRGEDVALTLKEYELLLLLVQNPGLVFSRDQLLNRIWGYDFDGESRTVDVHIRTLRQKLGACGDYIQTVRGVGYKLEDGR